MYFPMSDNYFEYLHTYLYIYMDSLASFLGYVKKNIFCIFNLTSFKVKIILKRQENIYLSLYFINH